MIMDSCTDRVLRKERDSILCSLGDCKVWMTSVQSVRTTTWRVGVGSWTTRSTRSRPFNPASVGMVHEDFSCPLCIIYHVCFILNEIHPRYRVFLVSVTFIFLRTFKDWETRINSSLCRQLVGFLAEGILQRSVWLGFVICWRILK